MAGVPSSAPASFPGLPMDHVLDLLGQLEIFVGDALGSMVLQAHLDPCIGGGDVGMVPSGLGEMTDRVDHHQCSFPTVSAVFAADPAAFQLPVRQFLLEALFDFVRRNMCVPCCVRSWRATSSIERVLQPSEIANEREVPQSIPVFMVRKARSRKNLGRERLNRSAFPRERTVTVPARLHLGFLDLNGESRPSIRQHRPRDQRAQDQHHVSTRLRSRE